MMIRTFIALEIPGEALDAVKDFRDKVLGLIQNIRWEPIEKQHITLKFLGDTKESIVDQICEEINKVICNTNKLELSFSRFGVFKRGRDPRILWIGIDSNNQLKQFAADLENSVAKYGFAKEEREFKPHITLLRFRGHEDADNILRLTRTELPEINFIPEKVVFMKSELKPGGSIYVPIKIFQLNK